MDEASKTGCKFNRWLCTNAHTVRNRYTKSVFKKSEGVGMEKQMWWHIGHIGHGIEEEGMMGELL